MYDPLELAAPFMLERRRIIQSLCHQSLDWDEQIPDSMARQWKPWKSNVLLLEEITVERCFKPKKLGKIRKYNLHHFFAHQSIDMVSVATFEGLMKMIRFIAV